MNKLQKRVQQRGQGGFTLIELLVVIAILAILAGVVVFAVGNSTANADLSACKTEGASIITAGAAAETANKVNASGAYEGLNDYLSNSGNLKYFTITGGQANGARTTVSAITAIAKKASAPAACVAPVAGTDFKFTAIP